MRWWAFPLLALAALPSTACLATGRAVTLTAGLEIPLVTAQPLSSRTNVKGDMVALVTAADVSVDGVVVIPKGAQATGQVVDARAKGAMGMSGRLVVRPLYLRIGDTTVRLAGVSSRKAGVEAGAIVGMVLIAPVFTGRSAVIPPGTAMPATVERSVDVDPQVAG